MKIRIIAMVSVVLILCFAPLSIFASATTRQIYDYNQFVTNVTVDGDNDIVTLEFPLENVKHIFKSSINGQVAEYEEFYGYSYAHQGYAYLASEKGFTYTDEIYIMGDGLLSASNIPAGTVITFEGVITTRDTIYPPDSTSTDDYYVRPYAIARDSSYNALVWNSLDSNASSFSSGEKFVVSSTFTKPNGTKYLDPMIKLTYYFNGEDGEYFIVTLTSVKMSMSITSLQHLQAQTGYTNKLLEDIKNGSVEHQSKAEEYSMAVDENISDASEVLDVLDEMSKPNVDDLGEQVDVFEIVSEEEINEYTSLFAEIMNCEIVISFLMLSVLGAFVSYVLFGKKG